MILHEFNQCMPALDSIRDLMDYEFSFKVIKYVWLPYTYVFVRVNLLYTLVRLSGGQIL